MENFAVIDLGSNSCRMTITQIQEDGSYAVTHRLKEMVRLSENENATDTPTLQAEAIDRTIAALKSFAAVYQGRGDRRNAKGQQPKEISQTR